MAKVRKKTTEKKKEKKKRRLFGTCSTKHMFFSGGKVFQFRPFDPFDQKHVFYKKSFLGKNAKKHVFTLFVKINPFSKMTLKRKNIFF